MTPKAQATKKKKGKLGFLKFKKFCASGDIVRKVILTSVCEDTEKSKPLYIAGGNIKW